ELSRMQRIGQPRAGPSRGDDRTIRIGNLERYAAFNVADRRDLPEDVIEVLTAHPVEIHREANGAEQPPIAKRVIEQVHDNLVRLARNGCLEGAEAAAGPAQRFRLRDQIVADAGV